MFSITKRRILVAVTIVLTIGLALGLSASSVGITSEVGTGGQPLYATTDLSAVPQSVVNDATRLATQLFGEYEAKYRGFVDELLASYVESKGKDLVILFNPGGWGASLVEAAPDWESILAGIQSQLTNSGNTSLILTYRRTIDTLQGRLGELVEMVRGYSSKAKTLAYRVEFLTTHNPGLKVVIAGESMGTVISDEAMNILSDNTQVFSIQTGPPFWHRNATADRTLVMTSNGVMPDSFTQGNILAIIRANLAALFGKSQPEGRQGTILQYIRAPGHDYWWEYPGVSSQVTRFFAETVGIKLPSVR
ncbi:MAG: hypothetical protein Q8O05_00565 [Chloroflexota bacterium]|nr:hypothetical protein [Chloroflexota bacterium]